MNLAMTADCNVSSISFFRIVGSMFGPVNLMCAHQLRPPRRASARRSQSPNPWRLIVTNLALRGEDQPDRSLRSGLLLLEVCVSGSSRLKHKDPSGRNMFPVCMPQLLRDPAERP
jgi:hypothetical protein